MSLLNDLVRQIQGGIAQVNPMDGGADYRSVTRPRNTPAPQSAASMRRPVPLPTGMPFMKASPVSGYEDAAKRYEAAFSRGDLNSPDIIGQDPANFGYAADNGQYGGTPAPAPRPQVPQIGGGAYNQGGVQSIGGHIGPFGGSIGIDHGQLFGSSNYKGRVINQFGPRD